MKQQVARFSPHQNGKVFGVMTAVTSLIVIVPALLLASVFAPADQGGPPLLMMLLAPLFYLIFGYVFTAIGCLIYNALFKYIGGIEYEARSDGT
jgi:hypothetical protein